MGIHTRKQYLVVALVTVGVSIFMYFNYFQDYVSIPSWLTDTELLPNSSIPQNPHQIDYNKSYADAGNNISTELHNSSAKIISKNYLRLINTLHEELSLSPASEKNKRQMEDLIRSGEGLKPYTTERGEAAWLENGIVYRPWRWSRNYSISFVSEYEPYIPFNEESFFEGRKPDPKYKTEKKIILWYQPSRPAPREKGLRNLRACPDFPCHFTTNRKYMKTSSAMVFASQIMGKSPPKRHPDQIFILQNDEPEHTDQRFLRPYSWFKGFYMSGWKRAFNWTMTYRMDSDIVMPFGVVRKRPTPQVKKDYRRIVANKTKIAAWMVSRCKSQSKREEYVKELQKYIQVDIYGTCGMRCSRGKDTDCFKQVTENYKFYLSFESSFCPDYITEKFFRYMTGDIIIVARGNDQYYQHAPRDIFLNTAYFSSPKELAGRMLELHNNDTAYIAMLKEKDKYVSITEDYPEREPNGRIKFMQYELMSVPFCSACQRLWNLDKYAKSIPDIHQWHNKKLCSPPKNLNYFQPL